MPDFFGDLNAFRVDLEAAGLLRSPAWTEATVCGVIDLDRTGKLTGTTALTGRQRYREVLPTLPRRTSAPVAAYLTGSPDYWSGKHRVMQRDLHDRVLGRVDHPAALAVLAFLRQPPATLPANLSDLCILRIDGEPAHNIPALREAWESYFEPEFEPNPRVRVLPSEAMIRMGTQSKAESATSYGGNLEVLRMLDPAGAAIALNWLLERPTTARHQDTAVIAWMAGDPLTDPTPAVMPFYRDEIEWPAPINTLHVAILTARPPARMHVRWYWSGEACEAFARLQRFDQRLRAAVPITADWTAMRWQELFKASPRWADMVMTVLQDVLTGAPLSPGVMMEIVRLHRKPIPKWVEVHAAGLLEVWASDHGHFRAAADA